MRFTSWLRSRKRHESPRKRPAVRPTLEALEGRWLPSTLTVLNNHDSGAGSLRADIVAANPAIASSSPNPSTTSR